MKEKTIPQILCDYLGRMGEISFMPEVWREGCGAVFLTGEISSGDDYAEGSVLATVGFEIAVRCGETSEQRNEAISLLTRIDEYFKSCPITVGDMGGYVIPVSGARQTEVQKNGTAEYRAEYLLKYTAGTSEQKSEIRQNYINTGESSSPVWSTVGDGFYRFDEEKKTDVYSRRYFHENVTRADVCGYSPEISYEIDKGSSSPAAMKLLEITESEAVGEDAAVEIITVMHGDEGDTPGVYPAFRRSYSVISGGFSKKQGRLCLAGKLMARGMISFGKFVSSTGTFVSD